MRGDAVSRRGANTRAVQREMRRRERRQRDQGRGLGARFRRSGRRAPAPRRGRCDWCLRRSGDLREIEGCLVCPACAAAIQEAIAT